MAKLFSSAAMALGYARSRPPLHERIVALAQLPPTRAALDVGCGAGLSTRALRAIADVRIGIEPFAAMVSAGPHVEPAARFVQSRAEALPFSGGSFNLISAAGSLNYVDLENFWPEARRVLTPDGILFVYDFAPPLDDWFPQFMARYPAPAGDAVHLDPETLAALPSGFTVRDSQRFEIPLTMSRSAYLDYAMTETNVAHAISQGATETDIRAWCSQTIHHGSRELLFPGYFAVMTPQPGTS